MKTLLEILDLTNEPNIIEEIFKNKKQLKTKPMQSFTFIYTVPEADTFGNSSHTIKCQCVGIFTKCGVEIIIHSLEFPLFTAFELVSKTATRTKLIVAATIYFNNWMNNAKPIAMSEQEVNDILNINSKN